MCAFAVDAALDWLTDLWRLPEFLGLNGVGVLDTELIGLSSLNTSPGDSGCHPKLALEKGFDGLLGIA